MRSIERGDTYKPVDSAFSFEVSVSIVPINFDKDAFHACFLSRRYLDNFRCVAVILRPPEVHTEQHLSPILRFGTSGTRVY